MPQKRQPALQWQIFRYLLLFCLLLLVILWLFQTVFLDSFYKSIKSAQVQQFTNELAADVAQGDLEAFDAAVRYRGDVYAELVSVDGSTYTVSQLFPEGGSYHLSAGQKEALFLQARQNGGTLILRPGSDILPENMPPPTESSASGQTAGAGGPPLLAGRGGRMGRESILCARLVQTPAGEEQLLLVNADITPVNATVETLRIQLLYISLIMLVLAVGVALLLSRRVASPIKKLTKAAERLGSGEETHFSGDGYREVAALAETLDHAAQELAKTEELRRELVANVSHDLRTPLTLIAGYAEMMRDLPDEANGENLEVIIAESRRLSALVADMLDLSRLESRTGQLTMERVNLTAVVRDTVARFAAFARAGETDVCFDDSAPDIFVKADAARIAQVLYNLLTNALAHGALPITVTQRVQEGQVRVTVSDCGPGVPEDALPHIWDRYYRADQQAARPISGSGLGLAIVRGILAQHPGADYGVASHAGEGSAFWFSLPLVA